MLSFLLAGCLFFFVVLNPVVWMNGVRPMSDSVGLLFIVVAQAVLLRAAASGSGLRAGTALARVQTDLEAAKVRTKAAKNEDLAKDLDVAATALAEAKKDLTALVSRLKGTGLEVKAKELLTSLGS